MALPTNVKGQRKGIGEEKLRHMCLFFLAMIPTQVRSWNFFHYFLFPNLLLNRYWTFKSIFFIFQILFEKNFFLLLYLTILVENALIRIIFSSLICFPTLSILPFNLAIIYNMFNCHNK